MILAPRDWKIRSLASSLGCSRRPWDTQLPERVGEGRPRVERLSVFPCLPLSYSPVLGYNVRRERMVAGCVIEICPVPNTHSRLGRRFGEIRRPA